MSGEYSGTGKELVVSTKVARATENVVECYENDILENVKDLKWRGNLMGLLKIVRMMSATFKERPGLEDNHDRWRTSLVLTTRMLYIACNTSIEVEQYLKTGTIDLGLAKGVKRDLEIVDRLLESADDYLRHLERLYKELSLADDCDEKLVQYLVMEFDYYVYQALRIVELVQKKFKIIASTINKVYDTMEASLKFGFCIGMAEGKSRAVVLLLTLIENIVNRNYHKEYREGLMRSAKTLSAKLSTNPTVTYGGKVMGVESFVENWKNDESFAIQDIQ